MTRGKLTELLKDVDLALGRYGMAFSTTAGPTDEQKREWFEEARLALRRVRDALASNEPVELLMGDSIPFHCSACGKPKPNDAAWARPAMACECGGTVWTTVVTFRG